MSDRTLESIDTPAASSPERPVSVWEHRRIRHRDVADAIWGLTRADLSTWPRGREASGTGGDGGSLFTGLRTELGRPRRVSVFHSGPITRQNKIKSVKKLNLGDVANVQLVLKLSSAKTCHRVQETAARAGDCVCRADSSYNWRRSLALADYGYISRQGYSGKRLPFASSFWGASVGAPNEE